MVSAGPKEEVKREDGFKTSGILPSSKSHLLVEKEARADEKSLQTFDARMKSGLN